MRTTLRTFMLLFPFIFMGRVIALPQPDDNTTYDFVAGDSTLFMDNQSAGAVGATPAQWKINGGRASILKLDSVRCVSIDQYYTKMSPKLKATQYLGNFWTMEFDTWLDAGYDGNPGLQVALQGKGEIARFVPNRDDFTLQLRDNRYNAPTPDEFSHDLYYNRWLHMELRFENKVLKIYCNKRLVLSSPAMNDIPTSFMLSGDCSSNMKMLFKNFRVATAKKH